MPMAAPKPVSKYFRFDWNYAARATRVPALRPATFIIAAMPVLKEFAGPFQIPMQNMWLLWSASLFSLGALIIFWIRSPAFVKEYQNYEQFRSRGHSHRWIVWEFFHNLYSLSGWESIVHEAQQKHIILSSRALEDTNCFRACPIFPERSGTDNIQIFQRRGNFWIAPAVVNPVYLDFKNGKMEASDISGGGVSFHYWSEIPRMEERTCQLILPPRNKPVNVKFQVVDSYRSTRPGLEKPYFIRAKFIELKPGDQQAILHYVMSRERELSRMEQP